MPRASEHRDFLAWSVVILWCGLVFGLGCGRFVSDEGEALEAWTEQDPIPDVELVDQHGQPFRLGRYRGGWLVLTFAYSRCQVATACPMTMGGIAALTQAEGVRALPLRELQFLTLTLQPDHDDPAALQRWAERYAVDTARWTLATGPTPMLQESLPAIFGVLAIPRGDEIQHSVRTVLLDPDGRIAHHWDDKVPDPAELFEVMRRPVSP